MTAKDANSKRIARRRCALVLAAALLAAACGSPTVSGGRTFITNEGSGTVTVIDPDGHDVLATIALGKRPRGMVASPDGRMLYVALSGSPYAPPGVDESTLPPPDRSADGIGVIDVRENKVARVIPGGSNPEQLAISADGRTIYIANKDEGAVTLVDLASSAVVATIAVGEEPEGLTGSPDGKFVYVTTEDEGKIAQIDTATRTVIRQVRACNRPRTVIVAGDARRAVVACEAEGKLMVFDTAGLEPIETIVLGKEYLPMGMTFANDGKTLYVATGRAAKVLAIDVATNKIVAAFATGGTRPWGVAASVDGRFLYTANGPSNDVSVIDVATGTVVKKLTGGDRPWGALTVAPAAR